MKYEVIRRFRDKYTGEIILPGATFTCDEADRIQNLMAEESSRNKTLTPTK